METSGATMDVTEYSQHTLHEHILTIYDTYVGSIEAEDINEWGLVFVPTSSTSEETIKVTKMNTKISEAQIRTFIEILSNASDNVIRSRQKNVDPGQIDVTMTNKVVTIRNGGISIPVEKHPESGLWVPELIFGVLLTSSNYDESKERVVGGRNGYGAKLTNIFSVRFEITIGDASRHLLYHQGWLTNMFDRYDPEIEKYDGPSFVEVSYDLDFKRFKMTEYPEEHISIYARHVADVSFNCKVPVTFNGRPIDCQNLKSYSELYHGDKVKTAIFHYEWPMDVQIRRTKDGVEIAQKVGRRTKLVDDLNTLAVIELAIFDTPDEGDQISFVNGIRTRDGGVHTDVVYKEISNVVIGLYNDHMAVSKGKSSKKEDTRRSLKLNVTDIRPHISIILSCRLTNAKFTSQTKTSLASPKPKIKFNPDELLNFERWELLDRLNASAEAKMFRQLQKSDAKRGRKPFIRKLEDANFAGTKRSRECTLAITEGDSAKGYLVNAIKYISGGRDFLGLYPIRGKPLNVMTSDFQQIIDNREITQLKQALRICEGVDYTNPESFASLNYGHLLIAADSDNDGKHIVGLIANVFYCRFESLLKTGFVSFLRTPVIRAKKGSSKVKFYTWKQYQNWLVDAPSGYKCAYFKGLGSSTKTDIAEDFDPNPMITHLEYDDKAAESFHLAFDAKRTDDRKEWLEKFNPDTLPSEVTPSLKFTDFFNTELIVYSVETIKRAIPSMIDGMKEVQRKVLWGTILKGLHRPRSEPCKVVQLAGYIMEHTTYHHGESSIFGAIIKMAQNFVGSHNLPYLTEDGQFGTRNQGGKDASAPRYISTKANWWVPLVFRDEDRPILKLIIDEGEECEPEFFLPTIPTGLMNGCVGIGTGHSTSIPPHDPLHICLWLKQRLRGLKTPKLVPYFKGFRGEINLKYRFDHDDDGKTRVNVSYETVGKFQVDSKGCVHVTELPIGRWTGNYNDFLSELREKKIIKDFKNHSDERDTPIHFIIQGFTQTPTIDNLHLRKKYSLMNLVLLDPIGRPIHFHSINDILENFFSIRLKYYEARRQYEIKTLKEDINKMLVKSNFIRDIIDGKLIIFINGRSRKKADIIVDMEKSRYPKELLDLEIYRLTEEDVIALKRKIDDHQTILRNKETITPRQMWELEIDEFVNAYTRETGDKMLTLEELNEKIVGEIPELPTDEADEVDEGYDQPDEEHQTQEGDDDV